MSLLGEIKRRKVFQVAAVYAVVAWLIIQVVGAVAEPLSLPEWFDTVVIVLLAVGFPVAVILAWAFDITPEGIRSASPTTAADVKVHSAGQRFSYFSQALVLVAVGFLVVDQYLFDEPLRPTSGDLSLSSDQPVNRFEYRLPEGQYLSNGGMTSGAIALSPDGRHIVYSTQDGLYVRSMDSLEARPLNGAAGVAPSFAPDGKSIVYMTGGEHQRVSIAGGTPFSIARGEGAFDVTPVPRWGSDGSILFHSMGASEESSGIYRLPAAGGEPELLIAIPREYEAYGPTLLPDGDTVLFSLAPTGANTWVNAQIAGQSLATGERRVLVERGRDARYVKSGHLVYGLGSALYGVAFDADTLTVSGAPVQLVDDVMTAGLGIDAPSANFDIADDGTLVYLSGAAPESRSRTLLTWVDRMGNEAPLGFEPRIFAYPRLSPNGSRIAFAIREEQTGVWVGDLARRTLTQLSPDAESISPVWATDGSRLIYGLSRSDRTSMIVSQPSDGSVAAEPVFAWESVATRYPRSISPDGRILLVSNSGPPRDIGMLRLNGGAQIETLIATAGEEISAELSPDGRWLAYDSDESGRFEVYVRPFPNVNESRIQISVEGGRDPLFSRDGRELFYWLNPGTIMSVPVEYEPDGTFSAGLPRIVVQGDYVNQNAARQYDVSADGERFVVLKRIERDNAEPARIIIVQNWVEELKSLVPSD